MFRFSKRSSLGELVNSVSLLFVLALPTLMVVACGSNEVKKESERTKKIEQQEGKQSHGEQQQEPTKQQVSSYAELLLITTDLEAREESLKRQLENSQRLAATFTSLEADLDRLPTSLPALFNLVQNYEDASKLLYDLKVELIKEENARSLLSTELPLYILGFK